VVGGRRCGFDSQQSVQLLHEGGDKLRSAVGYDFPREAVEFPDVPKVEVCCSSGGDSSDRLDKMGALAYGVDGHHDRVIPA